MDSCVADQMTGPGEVLVTGGADKWPISCVCPLVNLQLTRHSESVVTLEAGVRFLSGVNSHVTLQVN